MANRSVSILVNLVSSEKIKRNTVIFFLSKRSFKTSFANNYIWALTESLKAIENGEPTPFASHPALAAALQNGPDGDGSILSGAQAK